MDREGNKLVHTNVTGNDWDYFMSRIKPYRDDLTVCCECTFNWYWLADACAEEGLEFVLAHALYVKAIHGGKNKNDPPSLKLRRDAAGSTRRSWRICCART